MKLLHLGYYRADYPTLRLSDVDPGAEVEFTDTDKARAVMVEGIFAPGDAEANSLLVAALVEQAKAQEAAESVEDTEVAQDHTGALNAAQAAILAAQEAAQAALSQTETKAPRGRKGGE